MSSASPAPASPAASGGHWTSHLSPDNRPYWSHSVTKASVWEKPSELKTPVELEMEKTPWKEYETAGRKYWVHQESKETTWEMPQVLRDILANFTAPPPPPQFQPPTPAPAPAFASPQLGQFGQAPAFQPAQQQQSPLPGAGTPLNAQTGALVAPGSNPPPSLPQRPVAAPMPAPIVIPDFQSHEEAERAFMDMLSTLKVTTEWTWEQTMRETITEPMYKALKSLAERKAAFERYIKELKEKERAERIQSLDKSRKEFHKALDRLARGNEGFKAWWSVEKAMFECATRMPQETWKLPRNDEERKILIGEFIQILKDQDATRRQETRARNVEKLSSILQGLQLDLAGPLRWRDVQATVVRTEEWLHDPELQTIEPIDFLAAYEEELKKAEKEAVEVRNRTSEERRRRARRAREDFQALLNELRTAGAITTGSEWKSTYKMFAEDERYLNLLGVPGSSPLDLFFDLVDELDAKAEEDEKLVAGVLHSNKFSVTEETAFEEFSTAIAGDEQLAALDAETLRISFDRIKARAHYQAKEDRRRAEKKLRLLMDDLRYAYKKLDPPVDLDSSYEDNLERIQGVPEFAALEDDTSRRSAFEKFIKRQKEKLRERVHSEEVESRRGGGDRERERERERDHRDRDRDREPSSRSHRDSKREPSRRGSHRSPEVEEIKQKREASEEVESHRRKAAKVEHQSAGEDGDVRMTNAKQKDDDAEEGEI